MELADVTDSKSVGSDTVSVRPRLPAPKRRGLQKESSSFLSVQGANLQVAKIALLFLQDVCNLREQPSTRGCLDDPRLPAPKRRGRLRIPLIMRWGERRSHPKRGQLSVQRARMTKRCRLAMPKTKKLSRGESRSYRLNQRRQARL